MSLDKPSLLEETMYNQIEEEVIEEEIEESEEEVIQLNFDTMTATTQEGFIAREVVEGEKGTWTAVSQADIEKLLPQPTYKDKIMDKLIETITRKALNDYIEKIKDLMENFNTGMREKNIAFAHQIQLEKDVLWKLDGQIADIRKAIGYNSIDYDKIPDFVKPHVQDYTERFITDMVQIRGDIL